MDLDVGRLTLEPAERLVDHDARVRQRVALALGAGGEQEAAHRRRLAHADRRDVAVQVLHRVVDRQARRDRAAGRVDVEHDVLLGLFGVEEQQLRDDRRSRRRRRSRVPRNTMRSLSRREKMSQPRSPRWVCSITVGNDEVRVHSARGDPSFNGHGSNMGHFSDEEGTS